MTTKAKTEYSNSTDKCLSEHLFDYSESATQVGLIGSMGANARQVLKEKQKY
jgi:hypothetical protein